MGNPVVHFEVMGKDPIALQKFYKEAFDWEMGDPMPEARNYAMAQPKGKVGIDGGIGSAMDGDAGRVTFYVAVPNLEAALSKIQGLGGKTIMPPDNVGESTRIAQFADPEGHVIGLVQS
jgi:predicted enzyme related to lactoylglutathione lyase